MSTVTNRKTLRSIILLTFIGGILILSSPTTAFNQNLLFNGGFEDGFDGWGGGGTVVSTFSFEGNSSLYFNQHVMADQLVYEIDTTSLCKISAWIYITPAFTGFDWGGIYVDVKTEWWNDITAIAAITPYNAPVGKWFQVITTFKPTSDVLRISVGMFGGSDWNPDFYIDDIRLFYKPATNNPPVIQQLILSNLSGQAPLTITGEVIAMDDYFGAVVQTVIFSGDGGLVNDNQFTFTYAAAGSYLLKAIVVDDDGAMATAEQLIEVYGDPSHSVVINNPTADPVYHTTQPSITISGNVSGGNGTIFWYNNRTGKNSSVSAGSQFVIQNISLRPGRNLIHVQSCAPSGQCIKDEILVIYQPQGYQGPVISNFQALNLQVAPYEKFECRFDVFTVADNPYFPYDTLKPANLNAGSGISVDAVFTQGAVVKSVPAFYDMDYVVENGQLRPVGTYTWKVRMAFDHPGIWQMKLKAIDEGGYAEFTCPDIVVTGDPVKPGFIRVSANDHRYFEFDNGTFFNPMGHGIGVNVNIDELNEEINRFAENGINFSRTWMMAESPFSDPWCSWATHHTMQNNGYMPAPLYSINQHFNWQDFSLRIAAPAIPNVNTPAVFRGFWDVPTVVKPSTTYRVVARVKTINLTGNGGLVMKVGGWLGEEVVLPDVGEIISPILRGNNNWTYLIGEYTTSEWDNQFPNLYLVLQEVTSGEAYVDQVTIQEVFPDGSLSENILAKPNANVHYYLDPVESRYFDYLVEKANQHGIYLKVVILEKGDWILNRIDPVTGLVTMHNGRFDAPEGSKLNRLYEYYWRYLIARWGYATAIHSWELVNEGAPGSYFDLVNQMAQYFDTHSPYPRMVTTSFWCCWVPEYWANSLADYADVHAYAMTTGWIDSYTIDGETYNREQLRDDAAAFVYAYSDFFYNDPLRNKPVIIAETDLDQPGDQAPDPLLALDTQGVWLHNFNWGHINHGGAVALIWNDDNINSNNLFYRYRSYMAFMQDIPLHKGGYVPLQRTVNQPLLRVWGQQHSSGKAAHFWIQNKHHTWRRVVTQGNPAPVSGTITISGLQPGEVVVELWDSWAESTSPYLIYDDMVDASGNFTFTVNNLVTDMAVKIRARTPPLAHTINLLQGWQGISSYLIPENPALGTLLAPIMPGLVIMYNLQGIYWPGGQIFTLQNWNTQSGYILKMDQPASLVIQGVQPPSRSLQLSAGWSLLPVISECPANVNDLAEFGAENLLIIKEIGGTGIFWPMLGLNTIGQLQPGKGYWIYTQTPLTVTYPACP